MQLRDMQFAKITGTEVTVKVSSAAEAKSAIKELRHKKKEVGLLKRPSTGELLAWLRVLEQQFSGGRAALRQSKDAALSTLTALAKTADDLSRARAATEEWLSRAP